MLKRLLHFLVTGHDWEDLTRCYCPGNNQFNHSDYYGSGSFGEERRKKQLTYGFTVIHESCVCGATRKLEVTGRHGKFELAADKELNSLRKMAGIE